MTTHDDHATMTPGAMKRLDPRSPLLFDTKELSRRPGAMLTVTRSVAVPEPVGTDVIAVPANRSIDIELRLESVVEGVLATGAVTTVAAGLCVRCLEPLTLPVTATFQELFVHPDKAAHHREVAADDTEIPDYELVDDLIDLEPVLVDALVPALPFQPVCQADCPGLCVECGVPLADNPGHIHERLDPRWSALASLAGDRGSADPPSTKGT
ncbi:YceD family protein [Nostocoides sp.]